MTLHDPCRAALPAIHVLQLPGWQNSGDAHWQSRWEALHGDVRVEQSDWMWPLRGDWMMRLDEAVLALEPDWRSRLLAVIANPSVALILMMLGIYGLIFEMMNPGFVLPGVVGGICLLRLGHLRPGPAACSQAITPGRRQSTGTSQRLTSITGMVSPGTTSTTSAGTTASAWAPPRLATR